MAIIAKRNKTPATAADLETQRTAFQAQLAQVDAQIHAADPLDVDGTAALYARRQALAGAVEELARRVDDARRAEAATAVSVRDEQRAQRQAAAKSNLDDAARRLADDLTRVDLAQFDAALTELAHSGGGYPSTAAIIGVNVRQNIGAALAGWQRLAQPPEDKHALALAERQRTLERMEAQLAALRQRRSKPGPGETAPSADAVTAAAWRVADARRCLLALVEPTLTGDELTDRLTAGIAELSDWRGNFWEMRREEQRKADLEEQRKAA